MNWDLKSPIFVYLAWNQQSNLCNIGIMETVRPCSGELLLSGCRNLFFLQFGLRKACLGGLGVFSDKHSSAHEPQAGQRTDLKCFKAVSAISTFWYGPFWKHTIMKGLLCLGSQPRRSHTHLTQWETGDPNRKTEHKTWSKQELAPRAFLF